jgi:hypothetical protein
MVSKSFIVNAFQSRSNWELIVRHLVRVRVSVEFVRFGLPRVWDWELSVELSVGVAMLN